MPPKTKENEKVFLIAEYFIKKNEEDKKGLSPLKMQKLLYYAQAWNLVFNKKKLFPDDFQAWIHGPAIPRVWQEFRNFDFSGQHPEMLQQNFDQLTDDERELLDGIWRIYGKYSGTYLEALSHSETPWLEARADLPAEEASRNVISPETMTTFYEQKLKESVREDQEN